MGWKIFDFYCQECEESHEEMVRDPDEEIVCSTCGGPCTREVPAPISSFVALGDDKARRNEALKKRSHQHSIKQMEKDAHNHGMRQKRNPWNVRKK